MRSGNFLRAAAAALAAMDMPAAHGTPSVVRIKTATGRPPRLGGPIAARPLPMNRPPVGWRDERRKRQFKRIVYRQRRNARLVKS